MTDPKDTKPAAEIDIPLPGTPEYEEVYQAALKKMEDEDAAALSPSVPDEIGKPAAGVTKKPDETKDGEKTPEQIEAEKKAAETPPIPAEIQERITALETQLATSNTRQTETRNWANGIVKRLREFQTQVKAGDGDKPALLDDLEGLEAAVEHVITAKGLKPGTADDDGLDFPAEPGAAVQEYTPGQWIGIVHTSIPDMDELMKDEGLLKQVEAKKATMGADWGNPLLAIRELTEIRSTHLHQQRVQEAVKTAIAEAAKTRERAAAMTLAGGGAGGGAGIDTATKPAGDNPATNDAAFWSKDTMTDEEFEKKRQGVLNT